VRKQRVGLEHHVDRALVRRDALERLAIEIKLALGRFLEACQHAQQRGLAAARRAEQGEELALVDVEREVVDGGEGTEPLGHVLKRDIGPGAGIFPWRKRPADASE
jgi:hypothetical protein